MRKFTTLTGLAALAVLTTACSGGGDAAEEATATTEAVTEEVATPETAAADADDTAAVIPDDPLATTDGIAYASLSGDAAAGKSVFAQCQSCHAIDEGVNKIGPSLAGIIGRAAGATDGYSYSDANLGSGLTWTEEQMYVYLEDPQRTIPKTKMIFPGLKDAQKRADVIAYLKSPA